MRYIFSPNSLQIGHTWYQYAVVYKGIKILKTHRACKLQKLNYHPEQLAESHKILRWCI